MKVFQRLDLDMIPSSFICGRWKKGANTFRVMYSDQSVTCGDTEQSEAMRLNHMCQEMTRLACRSAPFNEAYVAYMEGVKYTSDKVEDAIKAVLYNRASGGPTMVASNEPEVSQTVLSQIQILDPKVSQTKGRKKDAKGKETVQASGRMKSSIELSNLKKRRLCRCCKKMKRHDTQNCPNNPRNLKKRSIESETSENTDDDDKQTMDEDAANSDD